MLFLGSFFGQLELIFYSLLNKGPGIESLSSCFHVAAVFAIYVCACVFDSFNLLLASSTFQLASLGKGVHSLLAFEIILKCERAACTLSVWALII